MVLRFILKPHNSTLSTQLFFHLDCWHCIVLFILFYTIIDFTKVMHAALTNCNKNFLKTQTDPLIKFNERAAVALVREFFRAGYTVRSSLIKLTSPPDTHSLFRNRNWKTTAKVLVVRISNTKQMYGYKWFATVFGNCVDERFTTPMGLAGVKWFAICKFCCLLCCWCNVRTGFGKNNGVIQVCMLNAILIDGIFAFTGLYSILNWWCELDLP